MFECEVGTFGSFFLTLVEDSGVLLKGGVFKMVDCQSAQGLGVLRRFLRQT